MTELFHHFTKLSAKIVGSAGAFIFSIIVILVWVITGPIFHFSNTWQLIISTITNIVAFVVVFLIQNTQNRDTESINIKLDELIRVHKMAHQSIIDLDKLSDEQINALEKHYIELSKHKK
ncbi:MAG: hypothetical protein ACD_29C00478G0002 [uncultured bacterium]|nr:MAG: hypothetical protein ACD_29C00478G0002 [uncultured bacterium]